jgi:thiol-disulfide isomerase/thioredoxin
MVAIRLRSENTTTTASSSGGNSTATAVAAGAGDTLSLRRTVKAVLATQSCGESLPFRKQRMPWGRNTTGRSILYCWVTVCLAIGSIPIKRPQLALALALTLTSKTRTLSHHRAMHSSTSGLLLLDSRDYQRRKTTTSGCVSYFTFAVRYRLAAQKSSREETPTKAAKGNVLQQTMAIDGAEWLSLRTKLLQQQSTDNSDASSSPYARTKLGVCTAVTGTVQGQRVVGLMSATDRATTTAKNTVPLDHDSTMHIYSESLARIPDTVSEQNALWTLLQSIVLIHCVRPVEANVGGSASAVLSPSSSLHVVVVGGNPDTALVAARALHQCWNYSVTIVTADKPSGLPSTIRHLSPISTKNQKDSDDDDDDSLGFAAVLGKFDAVLDTLGNEQGDGIGTSTVIEQLAQQHGCHTYISTQCESQQIISNQGLLWGPAKAKDHVNQLQNRARQATAAYFDSPVGLGCTVQTLLEQGRLLSPPKEFKAATTADSVFVRGWSLKDFWEYTTWPRDAVSNVRFGFPGPERNMYDYGDDEDDENNGIYDVYNENGERSMISAPPMNPQDLRPEMFQTAGEDDDDANNPYIVQISSVKGLQKLVADEMTCVLFLSAPFCRTCRYLSPQYQRLARQYNADTATTNNNPASANSLSETDESSASISSRNNDLVFVKAQATGAEGKALGRALGIDSVPSFVLFSKGRRYGEPLSINRLPSKKLDLAMAYLRDNKEWDRQVFQETKDGGFEGGSGQASSPRIKLF